MIKVRLLGIIFSTLLASTVWAGHHKEGKEGGKCGAQFQCKAMKGPEKLDCRKKRFECVSTQMTNRLGKVSKKSGDKKAKAKTKFLAGIGKRVQKTEEKVKRIEENLSFMKDKLKKLNDFKSKVNAL